jgi:hypothetical protein
VPGLGNVLPGLLGTALGLAVSSGVLLLLLAGCCLLFGLLKLRPSGGRSRVVRSLDEALGRPQVYLPPDAPRGRADQLRTPELLEAQTRNSA